MKIISVISILIFKYLYTGCIDSDREVILFVDDDDKESKEIARTLARQFFTSVDKSIVKLLYYRNVHISMKFDFTYRFLEIRETHLLNNYEHDPECVYRTLARDLFKKLRFTKLETKSRFVMLVNSEESSIVANLTLFNLSQPEFAIYRVIKDSNSSIYKEGQFKFVIL